MKESNFIEQNKEKWEGFEKNLIKKDATPQEISKLFVQITDDLSYARTFYNKRSVKLYLNGVAKLLFNDINKTKKNKTSVFLDFWKKDLPLVMFAARKPMLISFFVFWGFALLGVVTSIYQPDFANQILGDNYISMTEQNIADGQPMHVYADSGEMETFLPILLNNMRVAFLTFFVGVFASLGSLVIMMKNGVMVGVFQFFFVERDVLSTMMQNEGAITGFFHYFLFDNNLFRKSFLSIWTHGTLEISAIIIAGGAGITLGKGFLFPGTYSRFQAFQISARQGLQIILGVSPVIFLAAFIEGFLTRHTDIPDLLRLIFILTSLAFVLIYFVWFPKKVAKNTLHEKNTAGFTPLYLKKSPFNPNKILNISQLSSETLRIYLKGFGFNFFIACAASILFAFAVATDSLDLFFAQSEYYYTNYSLADYFNYSEATLLAIFSGLIFLFVLVLSTNQTKNKLLSLPKTQKGVTLKFLLISVLLIVPIFIGLISINNGWFTFIAVLLLPLLLLICTISAYDNISFFGAVSLVGGLLNKSWLKFVSVSLFSLGFVYIFFLAIQTSLVEFIISAGVIGALTNDPEFSQQLTLGFSAFIISFSFLSYLILSACASGILYFTLKETHTAKDLLNRIHKIKAKS